MAVSIDKNQINRTGPTYGGIIIAKQITTSGDEILKFALVQGRYTGKWSFPKGHALPNETSIECAYREISEETSIETLPRPINDMRLCNGHYYIFIVDEEIALTPRDTEEIMNTKWVTADEMAELVLNADVGLYLKRNLASIRKRRT